MTKIVLILAGAAIATVLLGSAFSFNIFTPEAEASHTFAGPECTLNSDGTVSSWVHHWDKIIFQIVKDPNNPPIIPANLLKTPLDIKVEDNPDNVANIDSKIRNFLIDHNIVPGTTLPPTAVNNLKIDIIDVEYAIVCTTSPPFTGP